MTTRKSIAAMLERAPHPNRDQIRATIASLKGRNKERIVRQLAATYRVTEDVHAPAAPPRKRKKSTGP